MLVRADLKSLIRTIPDYPKPGIMFRDVTTLFGDAQGFKACLAQMTEPYRTVPIDAIAGIEARGFILGGAMADKLGCGFIPIRKKGKLPWKTFKQSYALEYGTDTIEVQEGAVKPGDTVVVLDDLLATGGTMAAAVHLLQLVKAKVAGCAFLIELTFLNGREKLDVPVTSLMQYES